ncbi:competence type IV pilus major pilin ComGC [Ornithinibacillus xuwenensis]|jgi:type IV pilus assembly protein PilA|uniref:Prepilin-type N-terminal cleavage/methylation domain-containing protein n=1 Tax=Ornithinibacillus xuwenensis TaxID=3144668 RepID=A0ABU9XC10_9BACI
MFKRIFKNEKGFTLIELLAVIVILGIILAIAVPAIGNIINNSEEDAHEANVELIENAARLAFVSGLDLGEDGTYTINELVTEGFLTEIPDPAGDHTYDGADTVSVDANGLAEYE